MAVYRSTSDPIMMLSFSFLPTTEKLRPTCMPWSSTTKGRHHNIADLGDQPRLTYNGTSTPHISMVVCLDTNLDDVRGDLM